MEIKKNFIYMLSTFLKRMSKSYTATASLCGYGVEEMPESMKKLR
ncbi:cyclic lactone autoinducer peptide [Clostridium sp. C2-6-12]|nr:cyclic lactone autoinducer peptide [Clostridium sp. C2-6-12]